ncbi:hypothetical protein LOZ53_006367 [Ophidiomyces ophidiicola]|nr:hypothetical protein LOZ55_006698 [Ophidiomyces ophidiicola]KAI1979923.1 hypothetical protein LOZ54_005953 [Ophidiomyces ophidiicola]KAI1982045.1 hypothetical protein LOZ53_006367 [Ophidiomyces ophidiicola]KAI1988968.1 hypothetical protein LOZ51_005359 [Ophidiomyces ophidiicola]
MRKTYEKPLANNIAGMTELSPDENSIIEHHSLNHLVHDLRGLLEEAENIYASRLISYDGSIDSLDTLYQNAISKLILALQGQDAAFNLRSRIADQKVDSDLAELYLGLRRAPFSYEHYQPLIQLVVNNAADTDIWKAVFDLIAATSSSTPPATVPPSSDATPVRFTSSSQKGAEQTRLLVEGRIFEEIQDCTFRGVGGFIAKYFEGTTWNTRVGALCERALNSSSDWAEFPNPPTQENVLEWWFRLQVEFLPEARSVYFSTRNKADLTGSEAERQVDLLLKARTAGNPNEKHDWRDIYVVGELKKSSDEIQTKGTLLQLARYVREVFIAQPTRRFVHAFAVCGAKMEAWVFDRSGPYSSGIFNIRENMKQFLHVILGYAMMSDEELGLETFMASGLDGKQAITVNATGTGKDTTIQLDRVPISSQYSIVCRGTSCFRTKNGGMAEGVAKFSWTSDKRRPEVDLLELAHQRGVQGIARVIGHRTFTSIADLREGLLFENRHNFRCSNASPALSFAQQGSRVKLFQSSSRVQSLSVSNRPSTKRRSPDPGPQIIKRSRSSNKLSRKQSENEFTFTAQSVHSPSLFDRGDEPYDNRIFRCLVITPAGRPIYDFESPLELLMALRDSILAHRSLYLDGNILHRDISENNIIITDSGEAGGKSGMLIDLDLAK